MSIPSRDNSYFPDLANKLKLLFRHKGVRHIKKPKYLQISYLYKLFISYLIIILICVGIMAVFSYRLESNNIKNWAINSNNELVNNFKYTVDNFILDSVDKISLIILQNTINNPDISYFFINPIQDKLSNLLKISDFLKNIKASNPMISSITIYSKCNDLIVSTEGIKYSRTDDSILPDRTYIYDLYDSGVNEYWGLKKERTLVNPLPDSTVQNEKVFITYVRRISSPSEKSKTGGSIAIAVEESILHSMIESSAPLNFGQIYIIDKNGGILSHSNKDFLFQNIKDFPFGNEALELCNKNKSGYFMAKVDGVDSIISYISSDFNDWKYITVKPIAELIETKYKFLGNTIILITLITLAFGLLVALLSTKSIYSPLKYLSELCKNAVKARYDTIPKDECKLISSTLDILSEKVKENEEKIEQSIPVIKQHFIQTLLMSHFMSKEDIYEQMEFLNIVLPFQYFMVLILNLRKYPESISFKTMEIVKLDIIEKAEQILSDYDIVSICSGDMDAINIILNLNRKDKEIMPFLNKLIKYINDSLNLKANLGVGNCYSSIDNINRSFVEAKLCINYSYIYPERSIISAKEAFEYEDNSGEVLHVLYEELTNSIKTRNKKASFESIKTIINTIREEKICYNQATRVLMQCLVLFQDTASELKINSEKSSFSNIYKDFSNIDNILDLHIWFNALLTELFEHIEGMKSEKNAYFIEDVKRFISENILNPAISLNFVADVMHINSAYLSRMFKQETGLSFVDYLMDEKLNAAKEMLITNKNMKIEDVCIAVGYSSSQYFIRKFKLKYGMTPGEFRISYLREANISKIV